MHNEALMIGFMMAGFEIALRGLDSAHPLRGKPLLLLVTGAVLMSASTMIKITSLIALGFLGMALARRIGKGLLGIVISAAILLAISAIVIAASWVLSPISARKITPNVVRNTRQCITPPLSANTKARK